MHTEKSLTSALWNEMTEGEFLRPRSPVLSVEVARAAGLMVPFFLWTGPVGGIAAMTLAEELGVMKFLVVHPLVSGFGLAYLVSFLGLLVLRLNRPLERQPA